MWVSEALLEEVNQNSNLRVVNRMTPLEYDAVGNVI
jgi:hypothetical protein